MGRFTKYRAGQSLGLILMTLAVVGCADHSDNIPTQYTDINAYMAQGWDAYAAGNFTGAYDDFYDASRRNALYLPSYDGMGWCAVRLTDFAAAEIQFSFVTTLADPVAQDTLLADAYAGLCLASAIKRAFLEINAGAEADELQALAWESISRSDSVFKYDANYAPTAHDLGFGTTNLHLLNAQNYFYLQEFQSAEEQLSYADPTWVDSMLTQAGYGVTVNDESMTLVATSTTTGYLTPDSVGIHHVLSATTSPPMDVELDVDYAGNQIFVTSAPEDTLTTGMTFIVDYLCLSNQAEYLYLLSQRIEELIEY